MLTVRDCRAPSSRGDQAMIDRPTSLLKLVGAAGELVKATRTNTASSSIIEVLHLLAPARRQNWHMTEATPFHERQEGNCSRDAMPRPACAPEGARRREALQSSQTLLRSQALMADNGEIRLSKRKEAHRSCMRGGRASECSYRLRYERLESSSSLPLGVDGKRSTPRLACCQPPDP